MQSIMFKCEAFPFPFHQHIFSPLGTISREVGALKSQKAAFFFVLFFFLLLWLAKVFFLSETMTVIPDMLPRDKSAALASSAPSYLG